MKVKQMSIFDIINELGELSDRVKEINGKVAEDYLKGYLDEAHRYIGGAYIALNTYLEELAKD